MSDKLNIIMKPVKSYPKEAKKGKKGSKYDPILTKFLEGTDNIVELSGMDANTLSSGLRQRIRNNKDFSAISVVTRNVAGKTVVYLEKKSKK